MFDLMGLQKVWAGWIFGKNDERTQIIYWQAFSLLALCVYCLSGLTIASFNSFDPPQAHVFLDVCESLDSSLLYTSESCELESLGYQEADVCNHFCTGHL